MAENQKNLTNQWYSFPENTQNVENYLSKRAEANQTFTNFELLEESVLPFAAFTVGTYFAIECMTPLGSAARMIKEKNQGPARWFINRAIP